MMEHALSKTNVNQVSVHANTFQNKMFVLLLVWYIWYSMYDDASNVSIVCVVRLREMTTKLPRIAIFCGNASCDAKDRADGYIYALRFRGLKLNFNIVQIDVDGKLRKFISSNEDVSHIERNT